ncbi:MAG TPA: hypothetical protein VNY51_04075 [Candidatus Dormibacteraeota bacterium]|nr:hypothetical protein [Candidatus Dormibacteraeota bacterium]
MRTRVSFLLLTIFLSLPLLAQDIVVNDRVVDPHGNALPDAAVSPRGGAVLP